MAAAARRGLTLLALLVATLLGSRAERYAVRPHAPAAGRVRRRARQLLSSAALLAAGGLGAQAQEARDDGSTVLAALDVDADGALSPEEFSAYELPDVAGLEDEEQKRAFLQKLFNFADLDGDGILSDAEARYAEFATNIAFVPSTSKDRDFSKAMSIVTTYDQDGDGLVNEGEYRTWMMAQADERVMEVDHLVSDAWVEASFSAADITGDRQLMAKEVHYAMFVHAQTQYVMEKAICDALAAGLIEEYDADGDEKLSGEEAEVLVKRAAAYPGGSAEERVFRFFAAGLKAGTAVEESEGGKKAAAEDEASAPDGAMAEQIRALFAWADADGDGRLDAEDLARLAKRLIREIR